MEARHGVTLGATLTAPAALEMVAGVCTKTSLYSLYKTGHVTHKPKVSVFLVTPVTAIRIGVDYVSKPFKWPKPRRARGGGSVGTPHLPTIARKNAMSARVAVTRGVVSGEGAETSRPQLMP